VLAKIIWCRSYLATLPDKFFYLVLLGLVFLLSDSVEAASYRVRPGDNLSVIARRFGMTLPQLLKANRQLNIRRPLRLGTTLQIPRLKSANNAKKGYKMGVLSTQHSSAVIRSASIEGFLQDGYGPCLGIRVLAAALGSVI
jgi:hypothetical protein